MSKARAWTICHLAWRGLGALLFWGVIEQALATRSWMRVNGALGYSKDGKRPR